MDIRQLSYFLGIVEEGNITKASEKLHIAQPHLSHQLKLLEEELGVKLVDRSTRKFQITTAGIMLEQRAHQIIELVETTIKELKDFNEGRVGKLSLGTITSEGDLLHPRIQAFHSKYPNINFEIHEGRTDEILEKLNRGIIEIGIIRTPITSDKYESIQLPKAPMVAAAQVGSSWIKFHLPITLDSLIDAPLLVHRRFSPMIQDAFHKSEIEPRILCEIEDTRTILQWANSGMGVAIVPRDWVRLIPDMRLAFTEIQNDLLITRTAVVWLKKRYQSAVAMHFLESFKE